MRKTESEWRASALRLRNQNTSDSDIQSLLEGAHNSELLAESAKQGDQFCVLPGYCKNNLYMTRIAGCR